jgi:hypothetical protein
MFRKPFWREQEPTAVEKVIQLSSFFADYSSSAFFLPHKAICRILVAYKTADYNSMAYFQL